MSEINDYGRIDPEIENDGIIMMLTSGFDSKTTETFVKMIREISVQKVDWAFYGGRIVIKAIGDCDKVAKAMKQLMPLMAIIYEMKWKKTLNPNVNTLDRLLSEVTDGIISIPIKK